MSTLNQIETQLRSWKLRPPSEHLKERLFGDAAATEAAELIDLPVRRVTPGLWQWLAPSMAIFVTALTLSTSTTPGFTSLIAAPRTVKMSELALKNPNLAAYFSSSGHSSHNGWPVA